jgi:molybdopterin converting factor small subunit
MSVKIEMAYHLQQYVDNQEVVETSGKTVRECLDNMIRRYPAIKEQIYDTNGDVAVILLHEGEPVMDGMLDNPVKDGDVIGIYPVIEGG